MIKSTYQRNLETRRKWKAANRDRVNRQQRDYYQRHKETIRNVVSRRNRTPDSRAKINSYNQRPDVKRRRIARLRMLTHTLSVGYLIQLCSQRYLIPTAAVTDDMISRMRRRVLVFRSRRVDKAMSDKMRQLACRGESRIQIAVIYGASKTQVQRVLTNQKFQSKSLPAYIPKRVIKSIKRLVAITSGAQSIINELNTNREVA